MDIQGINRKTTVCEREKTGFPAEWSSLELVKYHYDGINIKLKIIKQSPNFYVIQECCPYRNGIEGILPESSPGGIQQNQHN